jgi:hypothetical protein
VCQSRLGVGEDERLVIKTRRNLHSLPPSSNLPLTVSLLQKIPVTVSSQHPIKHIYCISLTISLWPRNILSHFPSVLCSHGNVRYSCYSFPPSSKLITISLSSDIFVAISLYLLNLYNVSLSSNTHVASSHRPLTSSHYIFFLKCSCCNLPLSSNFITISLPSDIHVAISLCHLNACPIISGQRDPCTPI